MAEVGEEIACPVCLEEFEEPKCLPSCAHNVCQQCLEGMAQTNAKTIECPVCRKVSTIPLGGVADFPKNHLLARLIERIPGRKEKKVISAALKNCKDKVEVLRKSLVEMESRFQRTHERTEEMKTEIKSAASLVVEIVQEQEKELLGQIDCYMKENHSEDIFNKHKENLSDLLGQASSCTESIEELLSNGEVDDLKDLQDVLVEQLNEFAEASETRTFWAERDTKLKFGLKLSKSEALEKFLAEGSLGTLQKITDEIVEPSLLDLGQCGIDQSEFSPFAVAVSKISGDLAVLDESKKRVHIMNFEGQRQSCHIQIQYGDLWDIAYTKDDEVVVANRDRNRLLHYNRNGKFERKIVSSATEDDVKFTFLSVDTEGRYLVTSAPRYEESTFDTEPCVCVYSPERELERIFGHGVLLSPKKALWYSGQFFVPDSEKKSVLVFDDHGVFCREIGKGTLTEPAGIAIDPERNNILVCDYGGDCMQIFKCTGAFVNKFDTRGSPVQIALSKDGKKIVMCCELSCGERILHILSYI